jgi:hypothetical protein
LFGKHSKKQKLVKDGVSARQVDEDEERKRGDRLNELERIKRAREERDREQELFEQEKRRAENEQFSFSEYVNEEKAFHLKQAKHRADIRLAEGRPKPIDIVYKNLEVDTQYEFDMRPPFEILTGLELKQLEELIGDVEMYLELTPKEIEFWKALRLLCVEQVAILSGKRAAVSRDVLEVFQGQSLEELQELQKSIAAQLDEGEDPEYWDSLHKQSKVEIARATLAKIHAEKLQQRLAQMDEIKQAEERDRLKSKLEQQLAAMKQEEEGVPAAAAVAVAAVKAEPKKEEEEKKEEIKKEPEEGEKKGRRRRREKLVLEEVEDFGGGEDDEVVAQQNARIAQLSREANMIDGMLEEAGAPDGEDYDLGFGDGYINTMTEAELMRVEMDKQPEENEEVFADEVETALANVPAGQLKYVPRKPQYLNRVKSGYEWNKYNSTHYSADNPPPKVVHGYRFNIFYTDLVNPNITPKFKTEAIPGNHDWVILRFSAGPPYLDVAFKIVNKSWERDPKWGFKAVFERGILRLWFNFKRTRYKR